jgi:hypothetical protein
VTQRPISDLRRWHAVQIDSDRRFRFAVAPEAFWAAIERTDAYRAWWPWLTAFEADGLVAGGVWRCAIRPPLPYTLHFTVHLDDVTPATLITARIAGDLRGTARLDVAPGADGCDVRLRSRLAPRSRAFRMVAAVARPLVKRGHEWVLDTGAGQLAGSLER